jgi:hypothetical protein
MKDSNLGNCFFASFTITSTTMIIAAVFKSVLIIIIRKCLLKIYLSKYTYNAAIINKITIGEIF